MSNTTLNYLIVPGWHGSPERHWQSHWQQQLPNAFRVEQDNWQQPQLADWVNALARKIDELPGEVILIAHSLGCITVAHWSRMAEAQTLSRIRGALLVAPADVERVDCPRELTGFAPIALERLPFASLLVGSTSDRAASAERALEFAADWGADALILERAGHINIESGHTKWEQGFAFLYQLQEQHKVQNSQLCA